MLFDLSKDTKLNENYKLMAQTILPSSEPVSVLISVGHKVDGTLANICNNICSSYTLIYKGEI
jgi:hypothetical protein